MLLSGQRQCGICHQNWIPTRSGKVSQGDQVLELLAENAHLRKRIAELQEDIDDISNELAGEVYTYEGVIVWRGATEDMTPTQRLYNIVGKLTW